MFLSIIVPAYNVDGYICRCLDSLLEQNIEEYEIIVVNDGSTDLTNQIIRRKYLSSIIYIDKATNTGLSDARNHGIEVARGDYVMFIDSDDYIENNCLLNVKKTVESAAPLDVVYMGYILEKDGISTQSKDFISESNVRRKSIQFLISELEKRNIPIPACFAIYRRKFLNDKKLRFHTGILHEDELWSPTILLNSRYIVTSDLCFYHYVIRNGSITQKKDLTQNGLDLIRICDELIEVSDKIKERKLKKLFDNHIAMLYMKAMCRGALYRKKYRTYFNRLLPLKKACFLKDRIKASLFAASPFIYYKMDEKYGKKL